MFFTDSELSTFFERTLQTIKTILIAAAAFHFVYMLMPPHYYVETHGSEAAARFVSLLASPTLYVLATYVLPTEE